MHVVCTDALLRGGRRERSAYPLPKMQVRRVVGLLRVLAFAHSPLTTPSTTSAATLPPPPHTIALLGAYCTPCGACKRNWEARLRAGADRLTGPEMPCASLLCIPWNTHNRLHQLP